MAKSRKKIIDALKNLLIYKTDFINLDYIHCLHGYVHCLIQSPSKIREKEWICRGELKNTSCGKDANL